MIAYSTSAFRRSLKEVMKDHRSCAHDVCNAINTKFELIRKTSIRFADRPPFSIYKFRIGDSQSKTSKSGAFRVYAAISYDSDIIVLLYIFTKKGPDGLDDVSKEYRKQLISEFVEERNDGDLVKMNLEKELEEVSI